MVELKKRILKQKKLVATKKKLNSENHQSNNKITENNKKLKDFEDIKDEVSLYIGSKLMMEDTIDITE